MRTKFWYKFWDKGYSTKNWIFRQAVVALSLERLLRKTDAKGSTDRMYGRGRKHVIFTKGEQWHC